MTEHNAEISTLCFKNKFVHFWDFIFDLNFLLSRFQKIGCHSVNEHWIPFHLICPFCNLQFDQFIGRIETFEQDAKYVLIKTNLAEKIPLNLAGSRRSDTATSKMKSSIKLNGDGLIIANNRTLEYFNHLNKSLIHDLYQVFKPDFEMFGYSIKELL